MLHTSFSAYVVDRDANGKIQGHLKTISPDELPAGEVLIKALWSSLNYKDALAATGHPGVVRRFPHVPGIDVAGIVARIDSDQAPSGLAIGQEVLVTGYDLGAGRWGGWSQYVRVPSEWVVDLPAGLSLRDSMILGTAGFTAAQSVDALLTHGITPAQGKVIVTGATGGVGCIAVRLLAKLGFHVAAVTGKPAWHEKLKQWGATEIVDRQSAVDASDKPLLSAKWAGAVDTVGGSVLTTLIRQTQNHGCVAACGLVGGTELPLSVYPFILRGITLVGIDSATCPRDKRLSLWRKLATEWRLENLDEFAAEHSLADIQDPVQRILAGKIAGRTIVKIA